MLPKPSRALYVIDDAQFVLRDDIVHEDIAVNELLIETNYSGINPADVRHSTELGICSTVVGYDFAGRVLKAHPTSRSKEGDTVAGDTPSGMDRPTKYGSQQNYLVVPDDMAFQVPSNLPKAHGAALAVVVMTAADVVHNLFKFPLPTNAGKFLASVLICGASSAVGLSAVQLARASGCRNIFATASPGRYKLLKSLGATKVFDYTSPTVVAEIASAVVALGQGSITVALDAVGSTGNPSSADFLAQSAEDATILASVILRQDGKFKMSLAMLKGDWQIYPSSGPGSIRIPARPADHWNAWKALLWAVANYGEAFKLPSVKILEASVEEALGALFSIAEGKHGFGKVVLRHPLR